MGTIDYTRGGGANYGLSVEGLNRVTILERLINFDADEDGELADADKGKVFDLPARCRVKSAVVEVITTEGATAVGCLGTVSDADAFLNHINFNALAIYHSGDCLGLGGLGQVFGLHTSEEVKINDYLLSGEDCYISCSGADLDSAVVRVILEVLDLDYSDALA